jgi:hypothetical protein
MRRRRQRAIERPVEGVEKAEARAKDVSSSIEGISDSLLASMRAYEGSGAQLMQLGGSDANTTVSDFSTMVGEALDKLAEHQAVQAGAMNNARSRLQNLISKCATAKAELELSVATQAQLESDDGDNSSPQNKPAPGAASGTSGGADGAGEAATAAGTTL